MTWRALGERLLAAVLVYLALWCIAAVVVLLLVPAIWAALEVRELWRWWAHVWGILGY